MKYHWKYIKGREGDYPEVYILYSGGNRIKVEANKDKKKVRLYIETVNGNIVQSLISNGVVLEEKDILGNLETSIGDEFCYVSKELSSMPDSKILRIIGGKYGVLTEFLGKATKVASQDVQTLKQIALSVAAFPGKVYRRVLSFLDELLARPSIWDFFDIGLIGSAGYWVYLQNLSYTAGGAIVLFGALLSGYADWILRRKDPYLLKLFIMLIPAAYVLRIGMVYQ